MGTQVFRIDALTPDPAILDAIAGTLRAGGTLAYPTETFYGLGALAFSAAAVEKIYALKRRDAGKPLSVVVAALAMAEAVAGPLTPIFLALARAFWPGPLTLVAAARPLFPPGMLGPGATLALRAPGPPWLRACLSRLGAPVTATSANLSGDSELSRADNVLALFDGKVDAIVDAGPTPGGLPSTIVDVTAVPPRILRPGAIPEAALRPFLDPGPSAAPLT